MTLDTDPFLYDFTPGRIRFGRGSVDDLGSDIADFGYGRALVITGTNIGANENVMRPVREGLEDRLVEVFDETTPQKSIRTAYDVHDIVQDRDIDVLVGVGGGSSLDIATMTSALYANYRPITEIQQEVDRTGNIVVDDGHRYLPLVFVPTTLAGADLSPGAGIKVPGRTGERTLISNDLVMSIGYYDPDLFETTPRNVLLNSAMNSFDKGIEALYSKNSEPITDGTAIRGLKYYRQALPRLASEQDDPNALERAVVAGILTQYGVTTPRTTKLAIVHAVCHGLRHQFGIQQGAAHRIVIPHILQWVLENTTGNEAKLAEAFDVDNSGNRKDSVVEAVTAVRNSLEMPTRLRDIDVTSKDALPEAAEIAYHDGFMQNNPEDLDPTVGEIEDLLLAAW